MRKVGVGLVVTAYALLLYTSLAAPAYARAHQLLGPAVLAAYMLIIPFLTRITTHPRCLVVLDPHQHGCHAFMIAFLLGVVGLALAR